MKQLKADSIIFRVTVKLKHAKKVNESAMTERASVKKFPTYLGSWHANRRLQ